MSDMPAAAPGSPRSKLRWTDSQLAAAYLIVGFVISFALPPAIMSRSISDESSPGTLGGAFGRVLGAWLVVWLVVGGYKLLFARQATWSAKRVSLWGAFPLLVLSIFGSIDADRRSNYNFDANMPLLLRAVRDHVDRSEQLFMKAVPGFDDPKLNYVIDEKSTPGDLQAYNAALQNCIVSIMALRLNTEDRYRQAIQADSNVYGKNLLDLGMPETLMRAFIERNNTILIKEASAKLGVLLGLMEAKFRASAATAQFMIVNQSHWWFKDKQLILDTNGRLDEFNRLAQAENSAAIAVSKWQETNVKSLVDIIDDYQRSIRK